LQDKFVFNLTLGDNSVLPFDMECIVNLKELLEKLADLSLNGESYEICLYALKLQTALSKQSLTSE